jgi:hypothetical protein
MMQELFAGMLGFTGDLIVDTGATFCVRDGVSLEREYDRHGVNIIAPLGWHYVHLNDLFKKYRSNWSLHRSKNCELYKSAVASAVDDILHEYVEDVSYTEQFISLDGDAPLSVITQHFQKVRYFLHFSNSSTSYQIHNFRFFITVFVTISKLVAISQ